MFRIQLKKEEKELKERPRGRLHSREPPSLSVCLVLSRILLLISCHTALHLACTVQHHHGIPGAELQLVFPSFSLNTAIPATNQEAGLPNPSASPRPNDLGRIHTEYCSLLQGRSY